MLYKLQCVEYPLCCYHNIKIDNVYDVSCVGYFVYTVMLLYCHCALVTFVYPIKELSIYLSIPAFPNSHFYVAYHSRKKYRPKVYMIRVYNSTLYGTVYLFIIFVTNSSSLTQCQL